MCIYFGSIMVMNKARAYERITQRKRSLGVGVWITFLARSPAS